MSRSVGKLCPVCQPSADAGFYSSPGGRLKKSRTSRALRVRSPRPCETSRVRVKNESKSMPVKTSPIPSSSWRTTRALAVRERGEQPSGEVMRTSTLSLSGILRGVVRYTPPRLRLAVCAAVAVAPQLTTTSTVNVMRLKRLLSMCVTP